MKINFSLNLILIPIMPFKTFVSISIEREIEPTVEASSFSVIFHMNVLDLQYGQNV